MKKVSIASTGTKSVRVPLLPIKWVIYSKHGDAYGTLALARLLAVNLNLN